MAVALRPLSILTPHELRLAYEDAEKLAMLCAGNIRLLATGLLSASEAFGVMTHIEAAAEAVLNPRREAQTVGPANPFDRKGPL